MDYSLLVGLDSHTHRLVIGIIDFIRQVWCRCRLCHQQQQLMCLHAQLFQFQLCLVFDFWLVRFALVPSLWKLLLKTCRECHGSYWDNQGAV